MYPYGIAHSRWGWYVWLQAACAFIYCTTTTNWSYWGITKFWTFVKVCLNFELPTLSLKRSDRIWLIYNISFTFTYFLYINPLHSIEKQIQQKKILSRYRIFFINYHYIFPNSLKIGLMDVWNWKFELHQILYRTNPTQNLNSTNE